MSQRVLALTVVSSLTGKEMENFCKGEEADLRLKLRGGKLSRVISLLTSRSHRTTCRFQIAPEN